MTSFAGLNRSSMFFQIAVFAVGLIPVLALADGRRDQNHTGPTIGVSIAAPTKAFLAYVAHCRPQSLNADFKCDSRSVQEFRKSLVIRSTSQPVVGAVLVIKEKTEYGAKEHKLTIEVPQTTDTHLENSFESLRKKMEENEINFDYVDTVKLRLELLESKEKVSVTKEIPIKLTYLKNE